MAQRLLIIDDSPSLRTIVRLYLAPRPFEFIEAADGAEGLRLAKERGPDLVVADLNMPVMDGLEFLSHFRGDHQTPPAQVIIVTTEGREDDHKRGLEAGASAYLKKPFQPHMLKELVQGLIAHKVRSRAGQ